MKKYGYIKDNKNNNTQKNNKRRNKKNKSNENTILMNGKNNAQSKNSPPPKNKKMRNKIFAIKKLNIVNNSSVLNIIKSGKRGLISQPIDQSNKTNNISKNGKIKVKAK